VDEIRLTDFVFVAKEADTREGFDDSQAASGEIQRETGQPNSENGS
jgi:hypothetical protein